MPFVLKFSPHTQRYQLADSCCGHPECDIDENLSHYYLDPAEIALVFWAPGMLFVHTETRVYKKEEKAEYCNLGVKDVEELEELMEHMKMKGIPVQQVTRWVARHRIHEVADLGTGRCCLILFCMVKLQPKVGRTRMIWGGWTKACLNHTWIDAVRCRNNP